MEHPMVTTRPASRIMSGVRVLGWLEDMSIPRSSIAWTTIGLILAEGIVPALSALSPYFLAKASAIWLRPAFSIQTNSTGPWPTRDFSKKLRMSPAIKLRVRDGITTLELHSLQVRVEVLPG